MKEFQRVLKRFMSINKDYIPALRVALFFLIALIGIPLSGETGGFLYAQF